MSQVKKRLRKNRSVSWAVRRRCRMNEINRKPAYTVTELASTPASTRKLADHHGARGRGWASLVHGASLTSEVSLWFVVGLSCGVGATRDGPMRPATRGSPPTTKQRRALEPSLQPLSASNSAAVAPPSAPPPFARPIANSAHRRRPGRGCASKYSLRSGHIANCAFCARPRAHRTG